MPGYNVDEEIDLLVGHIKRLGRQESDNFQVTFKVRPHNTGCRCYNHLHKELFDDEQVANSLESLAGTLKAAKKRKIISYGPELLLQVGRKYFDNF